MVKVPRKRTALPKCGTFDKYENHSKTSQGYLDDVGIDCHMINGAQSYQASFCWKKGLDAHPIKFDISVLSPHRSQDLDNECARRWDVMASQYGARKLPM